MRIPLTKYGLPQVVLFPAVLLGLMALVAVAAPKILPSWAIIAAQAVLTAAAAMVFNFFRDPRRRSPQDTDILLAPADGKITDIEILDNAPNIKGKALRIGIFLNIFNVHINRTPCAVRIDSIEYKKGKFKNAMNPHSSRVNESNDIVMTRLQDPADTLLVRQISGAIARRIVCNAEPGDNFSGPQKFGMIKFGSRTELYLPMRKNVKCLVSVGDKVKAGLTILVKYET
jgi:phosphatidylserine decarboxylase